MAQFIPFADSVEVNGQTLVSFVGTISNPSSKERMENIFKSNGLDNIIPDEWYSQEKWLAVFKEISTTLGPNTLFSIGKSIPESAKFPPEIDSLEKALNSIDVAYKMNHRGGEIGYYKVLSFDSAKRVAFMECKNPYPSDFDRGIITTMLRKFKPSNSVLYDVVLDTTKPSRLNGEDSCTYKITW